MANDEHLSLLRQGTAIWNEWRERNPDVVADLEGTDLSGAHLDNANFSWANLTRANLVGAGLHGADLSRAHLDRADLGGANLSGASLFVATLSKSDLSKASLRGADLTSALLDRAKLAAATLSGADLSNADLSEADLFLANLSGANLSRANLSGADLNRGEFSGANLSSTDLTGADLRYADLSDADVSDAIFGDTILSDVNLHKVIGLELCHHLGPSIIDFRTLVRLDNLPVSFLRGIGLSDPLINYLPSLRGEAIQFYSCFISYSAKDQVFVERLHADLQNKGVRCWFATHDLPIGAKIWDTIDEEIRLRDKLLVVLSKASLDSDWVEDEVTKAYAEERARKEVVSFPIRIDNTVMSTAEPWAVKLRDQRNIGDFRQWKKPAEYQKSLDRLLRDLKASRAK